jgi:hypothetical protein
MFPSPSEVPPWLSLSPSPAFAPWGMPFELEVDVVEVVDGVVAAADPPDELEVCVDWVGVDLLDELEELEPHAATPSATSTSSPAAQRRGNLVMVGFIDRSLVVKPE